RAALRDMPRAAMRTIIATGDLTAETDPTSRHYCHMYRAAELRAFLAKPGLEVEQISASSALATGVENEFITAPEQWEALLEYAAAQVSPPVPAASPGLLPLRTLGAHVVVSVGMQNQVGLNRVPCILGATSTCRSVRLLPCGNWRYRSTQLPGQPRAQGLLRQVQRVR